MSGKFFLDTNLLIYAIDGSDPKKQAVAQDWLAKAHAGDGIISYQVVQEWFHVVLRKAAATLTADEARRIYRTLIEPLWSIQSSRELLETALDLFDHGSISWWDALVVSAAIQGGCNCLLTEDLQHGAEIRGVKIVNPFRAADSKTRRK